MQNEPRVLSIMLHAIALYLVFLTKLQIEGG